MSECRCVYSGGFRTHTCALHSSSASHFIYMPDPYAPKRLTLTINWEHERTPEDDEALAAALRLVDEGERRGYEKLLGRRFMTVCPTCGNKRCPHATDEADPCTGSNEPGQPGSAYGEQR